MSRRRGSDVEILVVLENEMELGGFEYIGLMNDSNSESVLIFEEPEAHAFPYYTKILAERIALAKTKNQYFISTHNPYLLLSILEKAHKDDIAIFITYFEDYQTKVKLMSEKELEEIMELEVDLFFNIERFLEVQE